MEYRHTSSLPVVKDYNSWPLVIYRASCLNVRTTNSSDRSITFWSSLVMLMVGITKGIFMWSCMHHIKVSCSPHTIWSVVYGAISLVLGASKSSGTWRDGRIFFNSLVAVHNLEYRKRGNFRRSKIRRVQSSSLSGIRGKFPHASNFSRVKISSNVLSTKIRTRRKFPRLRHISSATQIYNDESIIMVPIYIAFDNQK